MTTDPILFGLKVVVVAEVPRYQLPLDVTVPPDFRKDFNQWALDFFGTKPEVESTPFVLHDHVFLTPSKYEAIRSDVDV